MCALCVCARVRVRVCASTEANANLNRRVVVVLCVFVLFSQWSLFRRSVRSVEDYIHSVRAGSCSQHHFLLRK